MRCVAVGCRTGRSSGIRIHSFPRDPKRRLEWAVKVNIAENGKLWVPPKDSSYGVCEAHFDEDQYEPRRTDRKLKPFAVPTLFSHRKAPKRRRKLVRCQPTSTGVPTTAAEAITVVSTATGITNATASVVAPKVASTVAKSQTSFLRPVLPAVTCAHNTSPIILVPVSKPNMLPVPNPMFSSSSQMPVILSVESLAPHASSPVGRTSGLPPLMAKNTTYEKLQEEATALRQQTDDLRREVTELSRQAVRVKASLARQSERLSRFLRMDQVEYLTKLAGDKPTQWTEPTLHFALDIYRCSPEAYRKLLVAHYPLPLETALRAFCIEKGVREGVPAELLQMDMHLEENQEDEEENDNVNIVWL